MRVGVFTPWYNPDHRAVLNAFASEIDDHFVKDVREYEYCDVAVIFGGYKRSFKHSVYKLEIMKEHVPRPLVILERGYVRRDEYWSAGINGINGRADFGFRPEEWGGREDRWGLLGVTLQPWKNSEIVERVLVCGQVPWDVSVQDVDHIGWCRDRCSECLEEGLEVRFAPHPYAKERGVDYGVEALHTDLQEGLQWADVAVTYNSNSGVDAVIAGVPVVAEDAGSMVFDVAVPRMRYIRNPVTPNRLAWAHNLAYKQWSIKELRQGLAWSRLRPRLEEICRGLDL